MKKYIAIILMIQIQLASAQTLRPVFPYEGQNIEVNLPYGSCLYWPITNAQGIHSLLEFEDPNVISLYLVYEFAVGCVGVRPGPIPAYYELGALAEGTYTLQVFHATENDILPIQNVMPEFSFQFQVRGAPAAVNTLSNLALILLVFGFLLFTLSVKRRRL